MGFDPAHKHVITVIEEMVCGHGRYSSPCRGPEPARAARTASRQEHGSTGAEQTPEPTPMRPQRTGEGLRHIVCRQINVANE